MSQPQTAPDAFLNLNDAYQLSTAVLIVIFVTQTLQRLTGLEPKWIAALVSLVTAAIGVIQQGGLPWYAAALQAFIRACQLYCMAGGAVGLTTKQMWAKRAPDMTEAASSDQTRQTVRPFWVRWF
jgi:hypothetical protein